MIVQISHDALHNQRADVLRNTALGIYAFKDEWVVEENAEGFVVRHADSQKLHLSMQVDAGTLTLKCHISIAAAYMRQLEASYVAAEIRKQSMH